MKYCNALKRTGLALSTVALASLAFAPGLAAAADVAVPSEKDETVYVYTNADGSVKNAEVSTVLKNPDGASELSDSSNLVDIKGDDDKSFTGSGDSIVWNAAGENVTYKGATMAEAPIAVHASYTLDGQAISPDDLAGKSGKVTIRYDFENRSAVTASIRGISQTIYTPFTCVTALMFDGKDFKNVTVENGKIINDGDDMIVAGYAMPGLKQSLGTMADDSDVPDHFTVTADVTNFELKSTMTIATAGIMSEFDASSLGINNLDGANALTDAMGQLIEGSGKITTGLEELASNAKQLEAGASTLLGGAQALTGGLYSLAGSEGLEQLQAGATSLEAGIDSAAKGVAGAEEELKTAATALEAAATAVDFSAAQAVLEKNKDALPPEDYAALSQALGGGAVMSQSVGEVAGKLGEADKTFQELVAGLAKAKEGSAGLVSGLAAAIGAANELAAGAGQLEYGAEQLNIAMPELTKAMQQAAEGSKTLTQGMQTFNDEGVAQLVNTLQNDFGGTLDRMNALSDAAKSYNNFGGITAGTTGTVKFVFETDAIKKQ